MIQRLFTVLLALAGMAAGAAHAQTPVHQPESYEYMFSGEDVYNAMTPGQQRAFDKIQEELRDLQTTGRALERGTASRRAVLAEFERKKAERDEKFAEFRGINGVTVTLWGDPPPDPGAIVATVIMERNSGIGGMMYPHWYKNREGAIVGSNEPPVANAADPNAIPAGPTVDLGRFGYDSHDHAPNRNIGKCRTDPPASMRTPVCRCSEGTFIYGTTTAPVCSWVEAN